MRNQIKKMKTGKERKERRKNWMRDAGGEDAGEKKASAALSSWSSECNVGPGEKTGGESARTEGRDTSGKQS